MSKNMEKKKKKENFEKVKCFEIWLANLSASLDSFDT